ncbi:MAG: universal stress protein UspA [Sphingobacteriaceae bacterium]|jgi:nucleotide-binding universal stress UspA family protein|nr:universal stress protein UspA [Sphingobacteriaceae bacterium]
METLNILIPTDFSEVSYLAIEMAEVLERKIPIQIHMLHVQQVNDSDSDYLEGRSDAELENKKLETLNKFEALKSRGAKFEAHVRVGKLTDQINQAAAELGADLVLMGTKGSDGFIEMISGSEAQHVARYLQVPVLTIRPGTPMLDLKNILLVADFELFGKGVQIETIKKLAKAFDSTIHLLQILTEGEEKYADEIEAQMKFFAEEHQLEKYETHLYRDRKVADGIRNFNREAEMDLVCIRTNARKGRNHLLFGSIAERLVNHCIKPLLTFQLKKQHA